MWMKITLLITLLLTALAARAEMIILIQGYQAKGADWRDSGITTELTRAGWVDGGHLRRGAVPSNPASPYFYTVELSTEAQLLHQLEELSGHIQRITEGREGETLILVGHSAGGVLGRLYMVRHPESDVSALITFSSPHLGTESAEMGMMLGQSPMGMITRMLGQENDLLGRSQGLFFDLVRERPGSLLFWLNRQPHPQARYISVVRDDRLSWFGDMVVPVWSQDMNQVHSLRGRAVTVPTGGGHGLTSEDGQLLVRILRRLRVS